MKIVPFAAVPCVMLLVFAPAVMADDVYQFDSRHTYASFEADHMGGLSTWRGKFTKSSGSVTLNREARTGSLQAVIVTTSVQTGNAPLDAELQSDEFFDAQKYPTIVYQGTQIRFTGDVPSEVIGNLTMHGVTRPVNLHIESFKCMMHPVQLREVCGANATTQINRADFGMDFGRTEGFRMLTRIELQVEALKQ